VAIKRSLTILNLLVQFAHGLYQLNKIGYCGRSVYNALLGLPERAYNVLAHRVLIPHSPFAKTWDVRGKDFCDLLLFGRQAFKIF
jgi:hypothetical protein